MFLVALPPPLPSPPSHDNACIGHDFVTNTPIKFIFAIAIEVPDYKNPMIYGINRKNKMATRKKACGISNFVINSLINLIFGMAIDNTQWNNPIVEKKIKVAYWSEMARNTNESDFRSPRMAAGEKILSFLRKNIKVAYWSEMARNETDFQSSKMSTRLLVWWKPFIEILALIWNGEKCDQTWQPFYEQNSKKLKLRIDLKWREMRSKVIFGD